MNFYRPNFFGKFCSICQAFNSAYLQLRAGIFKAQNFNMRRENSSIKLFSKLKVKFSFKEKLFVSI